MIKMIDTHSHLYVSRFASDQAEAVNRAKEVLSHIFLPNIDLDSIPEMEVLVERDPQFLLPMMGLHPCSVKENYPEVLAKMEQSFKDHTFFGVGETGLDYYWDKTFIEQQKESLRRHIAWALDLDLPLILHCRDSMDDVIEIVKEGQNGKLRGIFHCFNGTVEQGKQIVDLGFLLGIGGVLTYKNSGVAETVAQLPLSSMVLETDSPYLTPVPHRGKRNESSYIPIIARKLSDALNVPLREVAEETNANAKALFRV